MDVVVFRDAAEYWQAVGNFLLQKEAENCVPIGIVHGLLDNPKSYATYHLFAVREGDETVGAGWMTPPYPLGLTELPQGAIPLVVQLASSFEERVAGVVAPAATATAFKDAWVEAHGCSVAEQLALRLFQLSSVTQPPKVEGAFRQATESDRKLLQAWHRAFIVDCHMTADGVDGDTICEIVLKAGARYVWEVGSEPVAMVGFTGQTPSGVRIGWVYTPPDQRKRGYATALVATMSQKLLDEGRKFCFLYTDLANPTSNGIYQKIGYQPLGDSLRYTFAP